MYKYAYWQTPSSFSGLLADPSLQLVVSGTLIEEIRAVTARPKLAKYFPKAKVEQFSRFPAEHIIMLQRERHSMQMP